MAMVTKRTRGEIVFDWVNVIFIAILSLLFIYPMYYSLCASLSDPLYVVSNTGLYWKPVGWNFEGYKTVLSNPNIINGYKNTLINVVLGTSINMLLTLFGAYALSRRQLKLKKLLTILIVFTMYFSGGMIPTYLVVKNIGLYNTRLALLLPGAVSTWNLIVMKTCFQQMPASLEESARLDGANDFTILFRIIIPLSQATIAVIALFYAVSHWNAWFDASIYLRGRDLYPLQLVLREILISGSTLTSAESFSTGGMDMSQSYLIEELVKYCAIIVSTVPILCVYPFVQRYFITGIMMGSLKE